MSFTLLFYLTLSLHATCRILHPISRWSNLFSFYMGDHVWTPHNRTGYRQGSRTSFFVSSFHVCRPVQTLDSVTVSLLGPRYFGPCSLHLQGSKVKIVATCSSKTYVAINQITRHHIFRKTVTFSIWAG